MKRVLVAAVAAACAASVLLVTWSPVARADGSASLRYPNGDVATATAKCSPGDVCATIMLASGDQIKVLTGGSGRCNPYVMTFMRYHKGELDSVWSTPTDRNADSQGAFGGSRCGGFRNTHMLLDGGVIDMGVFQNTDGTVFVQFFGGSASATTTPAP